MSDGLIEKFLPIGISGLALLISFFSALISFFSYRLSVKKEKENAPKIDVLHLDSVKYLPDETLDEKNHQWSFKVHITNLSGLKNSILNVRMRFTYVDIEGVCGNLSIPAEIKREQDIVPPFSLEPYESVTGWFSFTLSENFYKKMQELEYLVEFDDLGKLGKTIEPKLVLTKDIMR